MKKAKINKKLDRIEFSIDVLNNLIKMDGMILDGMSSRLYNLEKSVLWNTTEGEPALPDEEGDKANVDAL